MVDKERKEAIESSVNQMCYEMVLGILDQEKARQKLHEWSRSIKSKSLNDSTGVNSSLASFQKRLPSPAHEFALQNESIDRLKLQEISIEEQ